MPSKLTDSVLKKITAQKVQQTPAWYFWAQTILFIIGGLVFFSIGVLASTSLALLIGDLPIKALFRSHSLLKLILFGLPIIWLLLALSLGFVSAYLSRKTERGYRFRLEWILVITLSLQILFGYGLAKSNWGESVENFVGQKLHQEMRMNQWRDQAWKQPRAGLMVGRVQTFSKNSITIKSPQSDLWTIDITEARYPRNFQPQPGMFLRFHGQRQSDQIFKADKILMDRKRNKKPRR